MRDFRLSSLFDFAHNEMQDIFMTPVSNKKQTIRHFGRYDNTQFHVKTKL